MEEQATERLAPVEDLLFDDVSRGTPASRKTPPGRAVALGARGEGCRRRAW
jgi:hypothetical protein